MDKVKEFVIGYYIEACKGCAEWCESSTSMWNDWNDHKRAYAKMLLDIGTTSDELYELEKRAVREYWNEHNDD